MKGKTKEGRNVPKQEGSNQGRFKGRTGSKEGRDQGRTGSRKDGIKEGREEGQKKGHLLDGSMFPAIGENFENVLQVPRTGEGRRNIKEEHRRRMPVG